MANFEKSVALYEPRGVKLTREKGAFGATFGDFEFEDENLDRLLLDMDALIELEGSSDFTLLDEVGDNDESIIEFRVAGEKHQIENVSVSEALREAKEMFTELSAPPKPPKRGRRSKTANGEATAPAEEEPVPAVPEPQVEAAVAEPVAANAEFRSPIKGDTAAIRYCLDHIINSLQALRSELAYAAQNGAEEPAGEDTTPKRGRGRPRRT
jgi:hypothetical protein